MAEFAITPTYGRGFELTLRCQCWQIRPDDGRELTEDDIDLFKRIEAALNENAEQIIQDPVDDDPDIDN